MNGRCLADSESRRQVMDLGVRRLEEIPLTGVEYDASSLRTIFTFGERFRLIATAPSDQDDAEHWMFFTPENKVLSVGPNDSVKLGRSDRRDGSRNR